MSDHVGGPTPERPDWLADIPKTEGNQPAMSDQGRPAPDEMTWGHLEELEPDQPIGTRLRLGRWPF